MKHQTMLMQFEKLPFLIMNFVCNPKSSLTSAERSTFTFLFTSVSLGQKKKSSHQVYEYGCSPAHISFQIHWSLKDNNYYTTVKVNHSALFFFCSILMHALLILIEKNPSM